MKNIKEKETQFQTSSGLPIKEVYWQDDIPDFDPKKTLGNPGEPPYARGAYTHMYRKRPWRIFMLTFAGTVDDARERIA